jgi:hypothetical protein
MSVEGDTNCTSSTQNGVKNSEKNHYIQYASNGFGFQSYGFYNANNGKIYIIEAYMNKISKIYVPS